MGCSKSNAERGVIKRVMDTKVDKDIFELVELLTPGPLGKGFTQRQASKILKVSISTIGRRLYLFKEKHPEAYERFLSICRAARVDRININEPQNQGNAINFFEKSWKSK